MKHHFGKTQQLFICLNDQQNTFPCHLGNRPTAAFHDQEWSNGQTSLFHITSLSHPPNPAHGLASVSSSALAQQGHSGNSSVGHLAKYFLICGENSPLSPTTCHSVGKDSLELTLLIPLASHPKFLFRELFLLQHLLKIAIKCKSSKGKSLLHKSGAKTLLQGIHVPLESKSHFPSL